MGKEIITPADNEIEKHKFQYYKNPIFSEDVNIDNVLLSNKISFSGKNYKYFIGYLYDGFIIKPLHIMLSKRSTYIESYNVQTKWNFFLIEDNNLSKKCNTIQDKVPTDIKKEFDSEPVYNKQILKTKIKSYGDKATDFQNKEMPKAGSNITCLAIITIDSILKK